MRIHFDNVDMNSFSGPNTFANRLARRLFESSHEVVFNHHNADISLVFIEPSGAPLANKVVQRLDGIWFKPNEFVSKNTGIKELFLRANSVIFQSQFDKDMVQKWWGVAKHSTVIHNGIDLNPVKELTIPALIDLRSQYKHIYVCSANWHAQKRLSANVQLFEQLRLSQPSSCLLIMGNHPDYRASGKHIFYTGAVGPEIYNQIYAAANWMLHLAWADHCPNVVIEALAQGTPIVCSDVGGTKELIGNYGVVLQEQTPYNFELADYDNPPKLDVSGITMLPDRSMLNYASITDIDIKNVAATYVKVFENCLKEV